jgi:hypothetical protein
LNHQHFPGNQLQTGGEVSQSDHVWMNWMLCMRAKQWFWVSE